MRYSKERPEDRSLVVPAPSLYGVFLVPDNKGKNHPGRFARVTLKGPEGVVTVALQRGSIPGFDGNSRTYKIETSQPGLGWLE